MTRTGQMWRNTMWQLLAQVLNLFLGLVAVRWVITAYGSEVNGLTGTINSVMSTLNLLQAGTAGAAIFALYRPLHENDFCTINILLVNSARYFTKAGVVLLVLVAGIAPIFVHLVNSELKAWEVGSAFLLLGVQTSLNFFLVSWFNIIFTADQRAYLLSMARIIELAIYYSLIFAAISSGLHFLTMYVGLMVATLLKVIFLAISAKRIYSGQVRYNRRLPHQRVDQRKQVMVSEISFSLATGFLLPIISVTHGLGAASVVSVYLLVLSGVMMVANAIHTSFSPGLGNVAASQGAAGVNRVYPIFQLIYYALGGWLFASVAFLIIPFISVYVGNIDPIYVDPALAVLIVAYGLANIARIPYSVLVSALGLYRLTYRQLIVTSVLSVVMSLGLSFHSTWLVLVGPVVFYAIICVLQHRAIRNGVPEIDFGAFWRRLAVLLFPVMISMVMYATLRPTANTLADWLCLALLSSGCAGALTLLIVKLFDPTTTRAAREYVPKFHLRR